MSFNDLAKKEEAAKKASDTTPPKSKAGSKETPGPAQNTAAQPKS